MCDTNFLYMLAGGALVTLVFAAWLIVARR